jgi:hypothetical protein
MTNRELFAGLPELRWGVIAFLAALLACTLIALDAHAQEPRQATISFQAPTHYTDGSEIAPTTPITYRVYQGPCGSPASAKQLVGEITQTQTVINAGLERGGNYGWHVTAVVGSEESDPSNEGCKSFRVPQTVTITVQ